VFWEKKFQSCLAGCKHETLSKAAKNAKITIENARLVKKMDPSAKVGAAEENWRTQLVVNLLVSGNEGVVATRFI